MKIMEYVPGTTVSPRVRGHTIKQKTVDYMAKARMKSVADHVNMSMENDEYTKEEIVLEMGDTHHTTQNSTVQYKQSVKQSTDIFVPSKM